MGRETGGSAGSADQAPRRRGLRGRSSRMQRGATLVEYSLVVALLVVGAVASAEFLTDQADSEVTNQADCVSQRPPPAGCQLSPIITTTSVGGSATVPTTGGPLPTGGTGSSTTTTTAVVPPPPADVAWAGPPTVSGSAGSWSISITVNATSGGAPAPGTSVRVDFQITQPSTQAPQTVGCVTDAAGTCTIVYNVPFNNVTQVQVTHRSTSPGGGTPPGSNWCVPGPGAPACP